MPTPCRIRIASASLVPVSRITIGTLTWNCAGRRHDAVGDVVGPRDPAEDVEENRLDRGIAGDDPEGVDDLLGIRAAADVEEVGRLAAVVLDEVHRRHRQAGAVHHAADVAVQLDEREVGAPRRHLAGLLRALVAEQRQVGPPVQLVVVDHDLGVERHDLALRRRDQRIDLRQRAAVGGEDAVKLLHDPGRRAGLGDVGVEEERQAQRLVRQQPVAWVDREAANLLRGRRGDFLDVDAAGRAHHEHGPLGVAVHDQADVGLARDVSRGNHQHLLDDQALDASFRGCARRPPWPPPATWPASRRRPCRARPRAPAP